MATIEVSTWAELRSAITYADSGDTIKLIADIDCNDEIPEGVSSTIATNQLSGALTITGEYTENNVTKSRVIRNLRTSTTSAVTIFKLNIGGTSGSVFVKNIDFINLILEAPLVLHSNSTDGYRQNVTFQNCRFTGKRTDNLMEVNSSGYGGGTLYLQSCYCNIPYYGNAISKLQLINLVTMSSANRSLAYASNSRFRETFTGTYTPSSTDGDVTCGVFSLRLSGCRIEGEVVSGKYPRYHSNSTISGYTSGAQNVYDVDFKLTNNTDTSVPLYAFKGVVKIPIRKKDDESTTYTISSASTGVIQATESQMQDTEWLIEQGFDVVPSDT